MAKRVLKRPSKQCPLSSTNAMKTLMFLKCNENVLQTGPCCTCHSVSALRHVGAGMGNCLFCPGNHFRDDVQVEAMSSVKGHRTLAEN